MKGSFNTLWYCSFSSLLWKVKDRGCRTLDRLLYIRTTILGCILNVVQLANWVKDHYWLISKQFGKCYESIKGRYSALSVSPFTKFQYMVLQWNISMCDEPLQLLWKREQYKSSCTWRPDFQCSLNPFGHHLPLEAYLRSHIFRELLLCPLQLRDREYPDPPYLPLRGTWPGHCIHKTVRASLLGSALLWKGIRRADLIGHRQMPASHTTTDNDILLDTGMFCSLNKGQFPRS